MKGTRSYIAAGNWVIVGDEKQFLFLVRCCRREAIGKKMKNTECEGARKKTANCRKKDVKQRNSERV